MNLLKETREAIAKSGHTPDDIIFIGSECSGHQCTWVEFEILGDVEYDEDSGEQKVASDLIIVFLDGERLWRTSYTGSEWWAWSRSFKHPSERKPVRSLMSLGYPYCGTLFEINSGDQT